MKPNETKRISTSMFSVRCRMLNVVVLAIAASSALADVHYVDVNSTNATPPFTNWTTAATNIQDAVDVAVAGEEIVVTNGTYAPALTVDKPLNVRSVNGPQFTGINGYFRRSRFPCVYLQYGATLSGFGLSGGYSLSYGAGAIGGTLNNCTLSGNSAKYYGGGAYNCTLNNCTLTGNLAGEEGGGAYYCTLNNCTLTGNSVEYDQSTPRCYSVSGSVRGGGAAYCMLNNCTLNANSALGYYFRGLAFCFGEHYDIAIIIIAYGGGAYQSTLNNCIAYFNTSSSGDVNYDSSCTLNYSCTTPLQTSGLGNITNAPLFVDQASGNLRLLSNSPCINAGKNVHAVGGTDLDGNPRIVGGTVDIGAYEFQSPASTISYAWLQQFNLPINPATDTADPDGDGVDNYHEWLSGTYPTNRFSTPAQLTIIPSSANVILTWSTNAVGFTLQSTTNLDSPAVWSTNSPAPFVINGQNTVTNPIYGSPQFYRLSQ